MATQPKTNTANYLQQHNLTLTANYLQPNTANYLQQHNLTLITNRDYEYHHISQLLWSTTEIVYGT